MKSKEDEAGKVQLKLPCSGMNDDPVDLTIVRVFMTDNLVGLKPNLQPAVQLWVAAVPRDEAVAAVLERVPSHYKAELTDDFINIELARRLNLKLGDVSELSSA